MSSEYQPLLSPDNNIRYPATVNDILSLTGSPTKPLAFPSAPTYRISSNSSSDTAVSEEHPLQFQPHFNEDEFSFVTPTNSTTDLSDKHSRNNHTHNTVKVETNESDPSVFLSSELESFRNKSPSSINMTERLMKSLPSDATLKMSAPDILARPKLDPNFKPNLEDPTITSSNLTGSPSKSILKRTANPSPKKVEFTSTAKVHHYDHPDSTIASENSQFDDEVATPYDSPTKWQEKSDDEGTPPLPPPHASSYASSPPHTNLTEQNLETVSLRDSRLKDFSSLSLDEKLQLFVDLKKGTDPLQLDTRLTQLNKDKVDATDHNIHRLSLSMQSPDSRLLESQANHTHQMNTSFGSSQSSLQSLKEDNRVLQSVKINNASEGVTMNDGIKGIPDDLAETIINQQSDNVDVRRRISQFNLLSFEEEEEEEALRKNVDSFDNSYITAEQSIMNLLNASNPESIHKPTVKREVKLETENSLESHQPQPVVKTEVKDESFTLGDPFRAVAPKLEEQASLKPSIPAKPSAPTKTPIESEKVAVSKVASVYPIVESSNEPMKIIALQEDESQASIRFHVESDWKLDHSNDGDREDNDDYTQNDVTAASANNQVRIDFEKLKSEPFLDENERDSHIVEQPRNVKTEEASEISQSEYSTDISRIRDSSDIKKEEVSNREVSGSRGESANASRIVSQESVKNSQDDSFSKMDNVLANSSNIAPPEEITLPMVENNNSFEEFARSLTLGNFEQSLSAEFEPENKPVNFISIWHLQDKQKTRPNQRADEFFRVIGSEKKAVEPFAIPLAVPERPSNSIAEKFTLQLQSKKFKEIHVKSRRIVSPDFDSLNVSGFLPELSDDSGFENHFKFLKKGNSSVNYSNAAGNRSSFTPLSTRNVLMNMDNDPNILEPPQPNSSSNLIQPQTANAERAVTLDSHGNPTLRPGLSTVSAPPKLFVRGKKLKSRFIVPSFEIKRSSSILSPRDTYNDIFEDVVRPRVPTIKGEGMKTLPSMDREDVKRIMSTKRIITQEEYKSLKLLGTTSKKPAVNLPNTPFDDLQQHALICNISDNTIMRDEGEYAHGEEFDEEEDDEEDPQNQAVLPHLANELSKMPAALLSKDQLFNDYDIFGANGEANSGTTSRVSSVVQHKRSQDRTVTGQTAQTVQTAQTAGTGLPEPDADLVNSVIFKTPPKPFNYSMDPTEDLDDEIKMKYTYLNNAISPTKTIKGMKRPESPKKTPIQIGSPVVLIRNGNVVTGVRSEGTLVNQKLRSEKSSVDSAVSAEAAEAFRVGLQSQHQEFESSSSLQETIAEEDKELESRSTETVEVKTKSVPKEHNDETTSLAFHERGRLFLRVIGLKNIELPELDDRKGEFSITLDNGVHCIKTPSYKLQSNNVAIGKEFELTVGQSLEFILTMKATYEKPKGGYTEVRETKVVKSKNRLSRMFGSKEIITTTKVVPTEAKDSWANKFAQDGSFARCYVDLEQFEESVTGETCNFSLTCYNEWETKTNDKGQIIAKRQPYKIGELEVKMLFVPRLEADEILPTSIRTAHESIDALKQELAFSHEGYLHQEGGDCENWKRRYFKLNGTSLIAHSEFSHKTRAKINLAKVVDVIYLDKENWNEKSYRNFSGVLLIEHAFKIKFANGEMIDFGAPNKQEKIEWIKILERIVKRNRFRRQPWVKLMLENSTKGEDLGAYVGAETSGHSLFI